MVPDELCLDHRESSLAPSLVDAPVPPVCRLLTHLSDEESMVTPEVNVPASARQSTRRARSTGLAVAAAGIVIFNVSPLMNWVDPRGDADPRTGYETDSLVPFIAYLGIGLLVALVYAGKRARRGQHRGLTLVSMAVAIAAAIQCIAFAFNPMGGLERGDDLSAQIGVFVGILGAAVWAVGSGLLAKEIEGDDNDAADAYDGARIR
jgi:hypothetical protein